MIQLLFRVISILILPVNTKQAHLSSLNLSKNSTSYFIFIIYCEADRRKMQSYLFPNKYLQSASHCFF